MRPVSRARRASAYRTSLLAYRDSARIVTEAQTLSLSTIQTFNDELQAMVDLGFDPVQALRTITAITNYVDGFVLQEQSSRQPAANSLVTPESIAALLRDGQASPLLLAFAQGGSPYSEESFEYGLRALIDGCATALNRRDSEF